MMTTKGFIEHAEEIKEFFCDKYDVAREDLEVIQVWYCKTIQNHKGLFIVRNIISNEIYPYFIECTFNGDANELYLDFYKKTFKHIMQIPKN